MITIIAVTIACIAAAVSVAAAVATRRQAVRNRRARERTFPWKGGEVSITAPMSDADYEALKARWQAAYGNRLAAHPVEPVTSEEQPGA